MPRLKPESLASVRTRIERAAQDLFVRQGFAATTTRDIARAVGMTAGALYAHYSSKEALFTAVVAGYRGVLTGGETPIRATLRSTRFPFDIPDLAAAIEEVVRAHGAYWKLWYVDVVEFGGRHFRSSLAPEALIREPALKRRLDTLRQARALRVEPEVAFRMVYMHLFNYFLIETLFGGKRHYGLPPRQAVRAMAEVFLHGMLAPGDSETAEQEATERRRS